MNLEWVKKEIIKVAKLISGFTGYIPSGRNKSDTVITDIAKSLSRMSPGQEKAYMLNIIDEITLRGRDNEGITNKQPFIGWLRDDFNKLNKIVNHRKN